MGSGFDGDPDLVTGVAAVAGVAVKFWRVVFNGRAVGGAGQPVVLNLGPDGADRGDMAFGGKAGIGAGGQGDLGKSGWQGGFAGDF